MAGAPVILHDNFCLLFQRLGLGGGCGKKHGEIVGNELGR
jgi:hypothetical protein